MIRKGIYIAIVLVVGLVILNMVKSKQTETTENTNQPESKEGKSTGLFSNIKEKVIAKNTSGTKLTWAAKEIMNLNNQALNK